LIENAVALIALDLPAVCRVGFTNVDDEECDLIPEAMVESFELPSLGTKGGSSEAAENQRHRLAIAESREPYLLRTT
jgi:hypothetical protein